VQQEGACSPHKALLSVRASWHLRPVAAGQMRRILPGVEPHSIDLELWDEQSGIQDLSHCHCVANLHKHGPSHSPSLCPPRCFTGVEKWTTHAEQSSMRPEKCESPLWKGVLIAKMLWPGHIICRPEMESPPRCVAG